MALHWFAVTIDITRSPAKEQDFRPGETRHYENMPMQYIVIFHGYKNNYFQIKNYSIFHIFALNIDCGYTLEPPH